MELFLIFFAFFRRKGAFLQGSGGGRAKIPPGGQDSPVFPPSFLLCINMTRF
jgi:hypothetical protein